MENHMLERNFEFYAEPEAGINTLQELNEELCSWASREHHDLEILTDTMEPEVRVDGVRYICRLGDPDIVPIRGILQKTLGLSMPRHGVGRLHGYQWIYFYRTE